MIKKIFMISFLVAALMMSGCSDLADGGNGGGTAQASPVAKNIPTFTTKTITGETVTNEIFASKKITMVNIWGTFCPPCIAEMPELGEMARSLPDDAQIIGFVCDASEDYPQQIAKAVQITREADANFVNIVLDENLTRFIDGVEAVPTTIFVNSKGEVVGKVIVGADVGAYKREIEKLLKQ